MKVTGAGGVGQAGPRSARAPEARVPLPGAGAASAPNQAGGGLPDEHGADDPRLEAILDEIETRAAVELAELEQARTASSRGYDLA